MKKYFFLIVIISFYSCKEESKEKQLSDTIIQVDQKLNDSVNDLLTKSKNYNPNHIDLSKAKFLENFNVISIFKNEKYSTEAKINIVNTILLKQYLYHLKKANQGYDLKSMRNGNAKIIIDYFLSTNNIDSSKEFINSAVAYDTLKNNESKQDEEINQLIRSINKEVERINKQSKEIINN